MATWRRVAYWISKATRAKAHARSRPPTHIHARNHARAHTHTETRDSYFFSTATIVSRKRLNVT